VLGKRMTTHPIMNAERAKGDLMVVVSLNAIV
jgi:hypothetical protein